MPTEVKSLSISPPFKPVYLFQGTQNFLIHRLRTSIIDRVIQPEDREFNVSRYDLNETPVELAVEDAMTLPFLGDKRVVVLENPTFLTGDSKKVKVEHNLDALTDYIKNPSPETILIIEAPYEKLDKRKKLVKLLEAESVTLQLNQISERDLYHLLKNEAEHLSAQLLESAHHRLLTLVGFHIAQLVNETHKLALYVGEGGTIDEEAVNLLATRSLESNVFDLVDHVMRGKAEEALVLLQDLLKQKEEPIRLLALIMRQVRIMLQTQLYQKQGFLQKEIASRLKLHPYAVKIASEQAQRFQLSQLKRALVWCSDADYAMKTGQEEKELALQLLIHRIAHLH